MTKSRWVGFAFALLVAGLGLYFFRGPIERCFLGQAFAEENLREYEKLISECRSPAVSALEAPYRTGKVLLIRPSVWSVYRVGNVFATQMRPDYEAKKDREIDPPGLDEHWYRLDPSLRAGSPDEVGTVIFCEYRVRKGEDWLFIDTSGGSPPVVGAKKSKDVLLKVYDWKARRLVGERLLEGPEPEKFSTGSRWSLGQFPDVVDWVERMPSR